MYKSDKSTVKIPVPGDMVTLRSGLVSVNLISDPIKNDAIDLKKETIYDSGFFYDIRAFRRGETAVVVEVDQQNESRVKILYQSGTWWGYVSDMLVMK